MSITLYSDSQLFGFLENSKKVLQRLGLKLSYIVTDEIIKEIKNKIPKIDRVIIEYKLIYLQDAIDVEFSKKSYYHKNIFAQLQNDFRNSMTTHTNVVRSTLNLNSKVDRLEKRLNSYKNLETLRNAVLRNDPTHEEKFVGISFAYLAIVDGLYTSSLQECYIWHLIARNKQFDIDKIVTLSASEIYAQFKKDQAPLTYFQGWDRIVRNSVGHSSFKFDETTQMMSYEDFNKKSGKTRIIEYFYENLAEDYYKLEQLYHAIFVITHYSMINDGCWAFCERYK